jgi:hypothetical protein
MTLALRPALPADRDPIWRVHDRALRASNLDYDPEYNRYLRHVGREFHDQGGQFVVGTAPPAPVDRLEADARESGSDHFVLSSVAEMTGSRAFWADRGDERLQACSVSGSDGVWFRSSR